MIKLKVTNNSDRVVGRLNQVFEPGKANEFDLDLGWRLSEVVSHPDLTVEIVSADPGEVPSEFQDKLNIDATDSAKEYAASHNVNLAGVRGTGKDGRVTLEDVKGHAEAGHAAGRAAEGVVSTFSDPEEQRKVEREAERRGKSSGEPHRPTEDDPLADPAVSADLAERDVPTEGGGTPQ